MSDSISTPSVVIKRGTPTPSIEVDNDEVTGEYASGAWEELIAPFTAKWVKQKKFTKTATVWTWANASFSFGHSGYSVFVAQFGLPIVLRGPSEAPRRASGKQGQILRLCSAEPTRRLACTNSCSRQRNMDSRRRNPVGES